MFQVNTVIGVLSLVLIVYCMSNIFREELYIIFCRNVITTLIRYVYCSQAKENVTNDIFIQYNRSASFTKNPQILNLINPLWVKSAMAMQKF